MDQADNLRKLVSEKRKTKNSASIITIASGKGGTGKTFFSVNFAIQLASFGKRVMVVDADFGLSNVDVLLGTKPKYNLSHVIRGQVPFSEAICNGHGGIKYVAGGSGMDELFNLKTKDLNTILQQALKTDEELDYIIFDSGAGVNDWVRRIATASDAMLLVIATEPTSLVDAFALTKSVVSKPGCPPISFVLNRAESMMEAMVTARNFKNIVKKYLDFDVNYLGYLLYDKNVPRSIKQQTPLMMSYPDTRAAQDIEVIARAFTKQPPRESAGGLRSFFERVIMNHGTADR